MADDFSAFPELGGQVDTATAPPSEASVDEDVFAAFPELRPSQTFSEAVGTFGRSGTGAFLEAAPAIAGGFGGAALGALAGPAAPLAVPALTATGIAAGLEAGKTLRRAASEIQIPFLGRLANPPSEELPPEERPAAFAGEVIGGGLPFGVAPLGIAGRLPKSFVGNFINRALDTAARVPKTFLGAEAASLTGAATGSGVAESEFPGSPGVRLGSELVGSFFNPTRLMTLNSESAVQGVKRAIRALSPAGRESQAAKKMVAILEEAGDDPKVIADMLSQQGPVEGLTAAQKTGNEALAEFEAALAKQSAKFGADSKKSAEEGLAAVSQMILSLRGTGDPAALQAAAELSNVRFKTILASRLKIAEGEAAEAAAKITKDTPSARSKLSKVANTALGNALTDARGVEKKLWEVVPQDIPARADNIAETFANIKGQLLPEEKLPLVVEGFMKRMEKSAGQTNTSELILLRSRALKLAMEADADNRFNDARVLGQIAEAAIDDIDRLFSGPAKRVLENAGIDTDAYNTARGFSRELHETFTRTFAGQSLQTGARGADRIPPELMLNRATSGGPEGRALKLKELEEATKFLPSRNLAGPAALENHNVMIDAQERLLRLAAADSIDPTTGAVNAKRLQKFIRDNEELMGRFPRVAEDLKKASTSQRALKDIENATKGAARIIENKAAFAKVADTGNPVVAINRIVTGKNPVGELDQLAKIAQKSGPEAVTGMQASIWDHAVSKATSPTGDVSMARFRSELFDPIRPGEPSLMEVMRKNKIITSEQITKTEELFGEINKIATAMRATGGLDGLVDAPGALVDLVLSVAGSRASTVFTQGKGMAGASLIAAGRGASAARNIFSKVPAGKTFNVFQEAAQNPEFMAMLLRKTATQEEAIKLNQQIHAYLWQAGLLSDEEAEQ